MRRHKKHGFTLIELIVIIVIMGAMASVAVPTYSRYWERTRFMGVVRDIADLMGDARERAISKDTMVAVHFDSRMQTFVMEVTPPSPPSDLPQAFTQGEEGGLAQKYGTGGMRGYQPREGTVIREFSLGSGGGSNTVSEESLHFRGDGTCEGARLVILNEKGFAATIQILPTTGQITIQES